MPNEMKVWIDEAAGISDEAVQKIRQSMLEQQQFIVHWPTGGVRCCYKHANELIALGDFMGSKIVASVADGAGVCGNCENEAENGEHNENI